jgi:diguanylate cyclase (GGDEF)-like protein
MPDSQSLAIELAGISSFLIALKLLWVILRWPLLSEIRSVLVGLALFLLAGGINQFSQIDDLLYKPYCNWVSAIAGVSFFLLLTFSSKGLFLLFSNNLLLKTILSNAPVGVGVWEPEGTDLRCRLFNQKGIKDVGFDMTGKLLCKSLPQHLDPLPDEGGKSLIEAYFDVIRTGNKREAEIPASGLGWFLQIATALPGDLLLIIWLNITEKKNLQDRLRDQALQDGLTGLYNKAWAIERYSDPCAAVMVIDLDRFKEVNDTLGHLIGDQLIKYVASCISDVVIEHKLDADGCRYGGDEFILCVWSMVSIDELVKIANCLVEKISRPLEIESYPVAIGASIGISQIPDGSLQEQIMAADPAMYIAKRDRLGDRVAVWDDKKVQEALAINELNVSLSASLARDMTEEWTVCYQPIFDIASMQPIGYEAFIRWLFHPWSPVDFIPQLEKSGLIEKVTSFVIKDAVKVLHKTNGYISVNVSHQEILTAKLQKILADIEGAGPKIPRNRLSVELIASEIISNRDLYKTRLAALGVKTTLLITPESVRYNPQLLDLIIDINPDTIKMSRSLMPSSEKDTKAIAIYQSIITAMMAEGLDTVLAAEGVEHEWQLAMLRKLDFNAAQGWLLAKPSAIPG